MQTYSLQKAQWKYIETIVALNILFLVYFTSPS